VVVNAETKKTEDEFIRIKRIFLQEIQQIKDAERVALLR